MKTQLVVFALAYVGLILAVSLGFRRRLKNAEDYFLAGRDLPASLVYATLCAAWIGATSMLVSTDEAYARGVSALWVIGLPAVLTVALMALFLAGPLRRLRVISLPELMETRYSRLVRDLAAVLIVWYMALLAASQMVALGNFLKIFLGRSYLFSLAVGTLIVLAYSALGGLFTVVVTDCLHFLLLSGGIVGLFLSLVARTPFSKVVRSASELNKSGYFNFFLDWKRNALIVVSFVLAWTISPIAWQRVHAARDIRGARRGLWLAAGTFAVVYGMIVAIGILSLPHFGGKTLSSPLMAEFIVSRAGGFLAGVLFMAVLAAILSTMDTAINTGALSLAHDILGRIFPPSSGRRAVTLGRVATALVGALAFLVATKFVSILKTIGLASEVMAEGLFVPGIAMVFLKKKLPTAGLLSLILGGGFALAGFVSQSGLIAIGLPAWPYSVPPGVGLSLVGFLAGWLIDRRRQSSRAPVLPKK